MMKRMRFYKVYCEYLYDCNGVETKGRAVAYVGIDAANPEHDSKTEKVLRGVVEDVYKKDVELAAINAHNFTVGIADFLVNSIEFNKTKYNTIKYTDKVLMTNDYIFFMKSMM